MCISCHFNFKTHLLYNVYSSLIKPVFCFPLGFLGTVLRPGFIHGTRQVGSIKLPLSLIGAPLEMVEEYFFVASIFDCSVTIF